MEWLFVHGIYGGWWLKINTMEQLAEYQQKVNGKYNSAFKMYLDKGNPRDIVDKLSGTEKIDMMRNPDFNKLLAAVYLAEDIRRH